MIPKFRAWDKENKKMYGCYGFDDLNERIYRCNLANSEFRKAHLETVYAVEDDLNNFELMQSTGLKDKDGVEIYEGDIVAIKYTEHGYHYYQKIVFENGTFTAGDEDWLYNIKDYCVVCGNIYEDKELLEVEG
ncbi:YopX family protein [Enterococcus avium]|uniref:YopX family protein n=1 Tax=Enterococcus avium TaxID=33945 RepID=UPI00288E837E|nr:YopX family protein [Enterococcus avium]MDT2490768.1 YopX family protein [Enterococcus avium]